MTRIKKICMKNRYVVLSFLTSFFVLCFIGIMNGLYPFGNRGLIEMDFYHQYFPFFSELFHKIKSGESLLYSWNLGLGSNFLALFSYYLASPLNWIIFIFPEEYLLEAMTLLTFVKMSLCAVTFNIYLRFHFKQDNLYVSCFACCYALSGFLAAYSWNIMWLDNIILAPLIIMGLEKLFYKKQYFTYIIFLSLSILSDYYLSIMICIFIVLWFLMLLFKNPEKFKQIPLFIGCSLLSGALAAVLLLPTLCFMQSSEFGQISFPNSGKLYFPLFDVLGRHFMMVQPELHLEHWPNIYCGVFVLLLIPFYFINDKILLKDKILKFIFMGFMLISFNYTVLAFVWHGFNFPNSLPARQSFLYIFLLLVMAYESFQSLEHVSSKSLFMTFFGALGFLLLCEKLIGVNTYFSYETYLLSGLFLGIYVLLFWGISLIRVGDFSFKWNKRIALLFFTFIILELATNLANTGLKTFDRNKYLGDFGIYKEIISEIPKEYRENYRLEKTNRNTKNDGTLIGYPSASFFSSSINSKVTNWYEKVGLGNSKVFYCYDGATPFISALLNVKYLFHEKGSENLGPLYKLIDHKGTIELYETNDVLPIGYMVPNGFKMPPKEADHSLSPLEAQNEMIHDMYKEEKMFLLVDVSSSENVNRKEFVEAGYYYGALVHNGKNGQKKWSQEIVPIGYKNAGEVFLYQQEGDKTLEVYKLNTNVLKKTLKQFQKNTFMITHRDSTLLEGTINVSSSGTFALVVPYDAGWTMKVDGKEQKMEPFGDAFLSTHLDKGNHIISLSYRPRGYIVGALISILSVFILTGLFFTHRRNTNKK